MSRMNLAKNTTQKHDALLQRIRDVFPDLAWSKYRFIDVGWDHEVIVLDEKIVFRFPASKHYRQLLASEVEVLNRLQPLVAVRIPQYTYVAPDGSFAGYPMIPGKTLFKDYFDTLDNATVDAIAAQIADFLTALHASTGFEQVLPGSYMAEDQADVRKLAKQHLVNALSAEDMRAVERMLADVDDILAKGHPTVFIHGDLYHNHLLWDEAAQQLGIIDFGDRSMGDPAIDFAELHEYGEAFVQKVYQRYAGPKEDTFIDRSWKYQCWTGVYMLTDYFVHGKNSLEEARELFDWTKQGQRD